MVNAAALAELLRGLAAAPDGAWLMRALGPGGSSWVEVNGWTVCVELGESGELSGVTRAMHGPEVVWSWGCERNWVELGPPANPAALLSAEEREAVGAVLLKLPAVEPLDEPVWSDFEEVGRRRLNWERAQKKAKRRRKKRSELPAP